MLSSFFHSPSHLVKSINAPNVAPYPLSSSPNCGLPNYKLSCNKDDMLDFLSVETSLRLQSPQLPDSSLNLQLNTCISSMASKSTPIPLSISPRLIPSCCSIVRKILCTPLSTAPPSVRATHRLLEQQGARGCEDICCTFFKDASMTSRRIRVRPQTCTAYTSVVDFKPDGILGLSFNGYLLPN